MDPLHINCLGFTTVGTFSRHNDCYVLLCPVKNSLLVISNNILFVHSMEQTSLESQFYLLPLHQFLRCRTLLTEFLLCAAQKNDWKSPGRGGPGNQVSSKGGHQRSGRRRCQGGRETNFGWVWGINEEEIIVKTNFYSVEGIVTKHCRDVDFQFRIVETQVILMHLFGFASLMSHYYRWFQCYTLREIILQSLSILCS